MSYHVKFLTTVDDPRENIDAAARLILEDKTGRLVATFEVPEHIRRLECIDRERLEALTAAEWERAVLGRIPPALPVWLIALEGGTERTWQLSTCP